MPVNRVDGLRMSTALTYLAGARDRSNLTIRPGTVVDRVVVDGDRAVGVRLAGSGPGAGETIRSNAVVLAAGAYASPAILLRSGIGPATDLRDLGISIACELVGVGSNLIDHVWLSVDVPVAPGPGRAPLAQVLVTFSSTSWDGDRPDLQLVPCSPIGVPQTESPTGAVSFVGVSVVRPRSRGRVWLRSADPNAPPRIDPGHFRHADDILRAIDGVRAARRLLRTEPLAGLVAGAELKPAPGVPDDDAEGLEAGIRRSYDTYHHPVGTCRMGPDPSGGAVVDARGRVHGVEGLWVADASIMPDIPSANTNLPTIMVAERVAGWLREDG